MQRLSSLAVGLLVVLAGCAGGLGGHGGSATGSASNQVSVYVSDSPAAMGDFQHVNVSVEKVVLVRAKQGCQHGCDGNGSKRAVVDAGGATVDLTRYEGANATRVAASAVPNGTYRKAKLVLSGVNATLTNGSSADVDAPRRVVVTQSFTVSGNRTNLTYDLAVHGSPGNYSLRLNRSASGPHRRCTGSGCNCSCGR